MEAAQNRPEHGAGEHAAIGRIRGLQDAEGRGRDDEADDDHAAEPDDERGQGHVPDCEHPVIIIAKPAAAGACMTRPTAAAPITDILLQADARGEPLGPAGVTFLVRRYAATGRGRDPRRARAGIDHRARARCGRRPLGRRLGSRVV